MGIQGHQSQGREWLGPEPRRAVAAYLPFQFCGGCSFFPSTDGLTVLEICCDFYPSPSFASGSLGTSVIAGGNHLRQGEKKENAPLFI